MTYINQPKIHYYIVYGDWESLDIIRAGSKIILDIEFAILEIVLENLEVLYTINSKRPIVLSQMAPGDQYPFLVSREKRTRLYFPKCDIGIIGLTVVDLDIVEMGNRELNFRKGIARYVFIALIKNMYFIVQQFAFFEHRRSEYRFDLGQRLFKIVFKGRIPTLVHQMLGRNQRIGLFFGELYRGHGIAVHKGIAATFEGNHRNAGRY